MSTEKEVLLVFDELCSTLRTKAAWTDPERRRVYLVRRDVTVPISADPRVTTRTADDEASDLRLVAAVQRDDQEDVAREQLVEAFQFSGATSGWAADLPLLGFDVCDADRYSALLNCGVVDDPARVEVVDTWQSKLNEHHLLRTLDDAKAFRRTADARVREHAPFFVMRLFGEPT